MGSAAGDGSLRTDAPYAAKLAEQYSLLTSENQCKWAATQPAQGTYDFAGCDRARDFAKAHGMAFRGHNLCWGEYNPDWLTPQNFFAVAMSGLY